SGSRARGRRRVRERESSRIPRDAVVFHCGRRAMRRARPLEYERAKESTRNEPAQRGARDRTPGDGRRVPSPFRGRSVRSVAGDDGDRLRTDVPRAAGHRLDRPRRRRTIRRRDRSPHPESERARRRRYPVMKKRMFLMLVVVIGFLAIIGFVKFNQIQTAIAQGKAWTPPPEAVTTVVAKEEKWRETSCRGRPPPARYSVSPCA